MKRSNKHFFFRLMAASLTSGFVSLFSEYQSAQAYLGQGSASPLDSYCQLSAAAIAQKENWRKVAIAGNQEAQNLYQTALAQQAEQLKQCRSRNWPQNQAIWLRLYPCDAKPGVLDGVLDKIVNQGYNQVYVEVFYDGQVLLPVAENNTPWPSVVWSQGAQKVDLLAQAIQKGRDRGLKVYAWLFTMNFGYSYGQLADRQRVLARNGQGQTTLSTLDDTRTDIDLSKGDSSHVFIDPYNSQAQQDYGRMLNSVLSRRPDGVLFDYVRYMRGEGPASVASKVKDLWIYGEASQQALLKRAFNPKGRDLIRRYLDQGHISAGDITAINKLYPQDREPLWQGQSSLTASVTPSGSTQALLQQQLWVLSVAHATQGILDFLSLAHQQVGRQGIPAGAVFFPDANRPVNTGGFDSRLQPWDRFPTSLEFHPMSYGICGNTSCITSQIQRVLNLTPAGTKITPALAGAWGRSTHDRPSLEIQMRDIRQLSPQINSVSHFSYGWQEPQSDRDRKSCKL